MTDGEAIKNFCQHYNNGTPEMMDDNAAERMIELAKLGAAVNRYFDTVIANGDWAYIEKIIDYKTHEISYTTEHCLNGTSGAPTLLEALTKALGE